MSVLQSQLEEYLTPIDLWRPLAGNNDLIMPDQLTAGEQYILYIALFLKQELSLNLGQNTFPVSYNARIGQTTFEGNCTLSQCFQYSLSIDPIRLPIGYYLGPQIIEICTVKFNGIPLELNITISGKQYSYERSWH